jgi:hypothetical protein
LKYYVDGHRERNREYFNRPSGTEKDLRLNHKSKGASGHREAAGLRERPNFIGLVLPDFFH